MNIKIRKKSPNHNSSGLVVGYIDILPPDICVPSTPSLVLFIQIHLLVWPLPCIANGSQQGVYNTVAPPKPLPQAAKWGKEGSEEIT